MSYVIIRDRSWNRKIKGSKLDKWKKQKLRERYSDREHYSGLPVCTIPVSSVSSPKFRMQMLFSSNDGKELATIDLLSLRSCIAIVVAVGGGVLSLGGGILSLGEVKPSRGLSSIVASR